jgi:NADH:ubiquinone oxidoreductase subunit 6 (subunit J)
MASKIRSLLTILSIGLFAGTLDIADNLIFNQLRGITPKMVFQYIASGLIGMQALRGGLPSVALGVAIHYTIALIWTAVFYAASRKLAILSRRPVISGLVYGGAIYLVMNFIVLPLSGVPHPRSAVTIASRVNAVLALLFFIGLPISLLVRQYSNGRRLQESPG